MPEPAARVVGSVSGEYLVRNVTRGTTVSSRALLARSFWSRLRGLLFRPPLGPGDGLVIEPCAAIHTLGMRYPLDVLFVDRLGRVIGLTEMLTPNRLFAGVRGARQTIELPAGAIKASGTALGDMLRLEHRETAGRPDLVS